MKIAIVGGSPSGAQAPFDDPEWEIWAHGNQMDRWPADKVDVIFEIHDDLSEHGDAEQYATYLLKFNKPVIVGQRFPLSHKNVTPFPFEKVERSLLGTAHLSSTPAYMMALALLRGADEIGIWGVDMAVGDHEYFYQRPDMYAWISYAIAKGTRVTICKDSTLYKRIHVEGIASGGKPDFGLPPFTEREFLDQANKHKATIDNLKAQRNQIDALIQTHDGCRQTYEHLARIARGVEAGQTIRKLSDVTQS